MTKTVIIASELSGSPQNFAIRNNFITIVILPFVGNLFIKLRLQMHWLYAMMLYICLSVTWNAYPKHGFLENWAV